MTQEFHQYTLQLFEFRSYVRIGKIDFLVPMASTDWATDNDNCQPIGMALFGYLMSPTGKYQAALRRHLDRQSLRAINEQFLPMPEYFWGKIPLLTPGKNYWLKTPDKNGLSPIPPTEPQEEGIPTKRFSGKQVLKMAS